MSTKSLPERMQAFYEQLNVDHEAALRQLPELYTDDIQFVSPIEERDGIHAFQSSWEAAFKTYKAFTFTDFKRILGIPIATPSMRMVLFVLTGVTLLGFFLFARWLVASKYGRVLQAIRDAESRVMFTGYNPLAYKLSIWTLSAVMCAVAGALYVPQVGIINPGEMSPAASIEIAIWTAVGGRATLIGPIVGAIFVNGAKSWFTQAFPEFWLYFLGALFIAVTLFLPDGIVGLFKRAKERRS